LLESLGIRALRSSLAVALLLWASPALASVESELAFHRGVVAYGEGRLDEAQRQFEIVLAEDPEDVDAIHYLALVAEGRGERGKALDLYDRAVAIDPEDPDLQFDHGSLLLWAGREGEARAAFERVVAAEPDRARAWLLAGIAAYRAGAYAAALPHLEKAMELDPSLRAEANYYAGLSEVSLGDLAAAEGAFSVVAEQSPISPLSRSAQNLREELRVSQPSRPWQAGLTAGFEWDSNPRLVGDEAFAGVDRDPDWRGVFRARGRYRLFENENMSFTGGYDGYWSVHAQESEVDLQTHAGWLSGGYNVGRARLGMRVDYAWTMIDNNEPFRHLLRATPTFTLRATDWSLSQAFFQYSYLDFRTNVSPSSALDRDGSRYTFGVNQYFFLPEPFSYVRIGALGDFYNSKGTEWDYSSPEVLFGAGYSFPYEIGLAWVYRFSYRDFDNRSFFSGVPPSQRRNDYVHWVNADLSKDIGEHWVASIAGSFYFQNSNVRTFDYNRYIAGGYLTYNF
jgi:tetratricopeptide (TPR) repeat protein